MTFKFLAPRAIICSFLTISAAYATSKHEVEVFGKWHAWQQVYQDRSLAGLANHLDDSFLNSFKETYKKNAVQLRSMTPLLTVLTNGRIQKEGFNLQGPLDEQMKKNLTILFDVMDKDVPQFLECLVRGGINNAVTAKEEESTHFDPVIEKYKSFCKVLFAQRDNFKEAEYVFALANRLYEYSYNPQTFPQFQSLMMQHDQYPLVRFVNSIVWHALVGDGWKHWHADTLKHLKQKSAEGHELVYVAGGSDFYQLLREGIRNITIIDAYLPTQERFYSEGWLFLIGGDGGTDGIGDEIRFGPECDSIKMKRVACQEGETFYYKLSNGKILSPKKATITWHVFDRDDQHVGHVIIHRRPVTQDDFAVADKKTFVMSYDEMIFIAVPDMLNGWGIDPTQLDDSLNIVCKQLRKPVGKQQLLNMRLASMINVADLKFINLASDPT